MQRLDANEKSPAKQYSCVRQQARARYNIHPMKIRLLAFWDGVHSSYWFVPSFMAIMSLVLVVAMIELDQFIVYDNIKGYWWIYSGGAEGARSVLSTIASSMITVAGVVFSITIVALTLASSQFGPRLLRNFVRDKGNQFVLGAFVAAFLYCLVVLRTVRGTDEDQFVPYLSVTGGLVMAIIGTGVLIYHIHHIAFLIQAENVIAVVAGELEDAIDSLFPQHLGRGASRADTDSADKKLEIFAQADGLDLDGDLNEVWEQKARAVLASRSGYVQAIDEDRMMNTTRRHILLLGIEPRPGDFVPRGNVLAYAYPQERVDDKVAARIAGGFLIGTRRTPTQDARFAALQLVEIAVRSLSPAVNDPFTAIACLDWLGSALSKMAEMPQISPRRYDDEGRLFMVAHCLNFPGMTDIAFNQIRQNAATCPAVLIRLLETIAQVARHVQRSADREKLIAHALMVRDTHLYSTDRSRQNSDDRDVEEAYDEAMRALQ